MDERVTSIGPHASKLAQSTFSSTPRIIRLHFRFADSKVATEGPDSMPTPNVQLAFQGGGAKLIAMLPIADAFLEAEADGFVTISNVSGTSAGAICAALVAAKADFKQVRRYLIEQGDRHIASLIPAQLSRLQRRLAGNRLAKLGLLFEIPLLYDITVRGRAVLNSSELSTFIAEVLKAGTDGRVETFEDIELPRKLFISASDIIASRGVAHQSGDLVCAIEDSCSLPVLLRSFKALADSHYVDGGLCDNLPVSYLDHLDPSPIFAIYPKVAGGRTRVSDVSNVVAYLMALFSASINHGVERSMSVVSKAFRFGVDTDIRLIDFEGAIAQLRQNGWYESEKRRARDRIIGFSKSYGIVSKSQARVIDAVTIDQYQSALESLTAGRSGDFRCIRGQFTIKVNHDRRAVTEAQLKDRLPDTTIRTSIFEVLADDVRFYRATVNLDDESIIPTIWSARNLTSGKEIPLRALPLRTAEIGARIRKPCLLEFIDSHAHIKRGDQIELQSVYSTTKGEDLSRLNLGKPDFFGFTNAQAMPIETAELVLVYPKSLGTFTLSSDRERSRDLPGDPRAGAGKSNGWNDPEICVTSLEVDNLPSGGRFFANIVPAVDA